MHVGFLDISDIVRFEIFTALTMKNAIFWDIKPCGSCKKRRFGGTQRLRHQVDKNRWTRKNVSRNYQPTHATKKYKMTLYCSLFPVSCLPDVGGAKFLRNVGSYKSHTA
jgi:hypothetical protein